MPAISPFISNSRGPESAAFDLVAIVPHATNELAYVVRDIRIGATGGDVVVVTTKSTEVTFTGAVPGERLGPFEVRQVKSGPAGMVGYV
jgi:hypothetical protein